jgi:methylphosphotriester-DNA--protein-cysteine methyltransferase
MYYKPDCYYKPNCPNAASISAGNRLPFNPAEAAQAAGYRPGKDCPNW